MLCGTRCCPKAFFDRNSIGVVRPRVSVPNFTATRILFNEALRARDFCADATIGIDADGYRLPEGAIPPLHIACIKGVLGDAVRFEAGFTRSQHGVFIPGWRAKHARRADLVVTPSRYCAERIEELYGVKGAVRLYRS